MLGKECGHVSITTYLQCVFLHVCVCVKTLITKGLNESYCLVLYQSNYFPFLLHLSELYFYLSIQFIHLSVTGHLLHAKLLSV